MSDNATATTRKPLAMRIFWILLAGLIGFLCVEGWRDSQYVMSVIFGFVALLVFGLAFTKKTACPSCGRKRDEIRAGGLDACEGCGAYLAGGEGATSLVPEDHVAETPVFAATLVEGFRLPGGCCLCGSPETRVQTVTLKTGKTGRNLALSALFAAGGGAVAVTGGGSEYSAEMPHCDDCDDGADLAKEAGELRVRFRSYAYQRAYLAVQPKAKEPA